MRKGLTTQAAQAKAKKLKTMLDGKVDAIKKK